MNAVINHVDSLGIAGLKSNTNQNVISEFTNQQARSKNIIIFYVDEQSNNDKNTSDLYTVTHIFNKLGTDIKPVKVHCLGQPSNKCRPLKIMLHTVTDVFKILGSSLLLKSDQIFNEFKITKDETLRQRKFLLDLRKQLLNEQISKGE